MAILVTGGCGYIGSHTIIDLLANGYEVISVDNNSRSSPNQLLGVEKITGRKVINYPVNLCDLELTRKIFKEHEIEGIIHFAAYKSVDESVQEPLMYYQNNLLSQTNILQCVEEYKIAYFVFSSSCSVYGNADEIPVTEATPFKKAESPYGRTKQIGEDIIQDLAKVSSARFALLRYFNPAGAHPSGIIGEVPFGRPSNLVPAITAFAAGRIPSMKVYGTDYDTRDGSCIRDFVHVCDIAHAHTLALNYLKGSSSGHAQVFNLGTGQGVTVMEALHSFEKISGKKLAVDLAARRPGDVVAIYANNGKAKDILKWDPAFSLDDIMKTAWQWEMR